jgi:hypothetical protein
MLGFGLSRSSEKARRAGPSPTSPVVPATSPDIAILKRTLSRCLRTLLQLLLTGPLPHLRLRGLPPAESRRPRKSRRHPLLRANISRDHDSVLFHQEEASRRSHDFPRSNRPFRFSMPASPGVVAPQPSAARTSFDEVTISREVVSPSPSVARISTGGTMTSRDVAVRSASPCRFLQKSPLRRLIPRGLLPEASRPPGKRSFQPPICGNVF